MRGETFCFSSLGGCHIPVRTINSGPFISCFFQLWCKYVYVGNMDFLSCSVLLSCYWLAVFICSRLLRRWWQLFSLCVLTMLCLSTFSCNNCFQRMKQKCNIALFNIFPIKYSHLWKYISTFIKFCPSFLEDELFLYVGVFPWLM